MKILKTIGKYLSVAIVIAIAILPMYWIFVNSFKTTPELTSSTPTFFPKIFTLEHYVRLFQQVPFGTYFKNSVYVALVVTGITLILSSMAAYGTYRCKFPGRELLYRLFASSYVFPRIMLLVPLFIIFTRFNVIDSLLALVIVNVTVNAPAGVWLLRGFFTSLPRAVEEAALVDGASRFQVLWKIFIPLSAPGVAAVALDCFLLCWTEYLFAMTFIMSDAHKTLPVGISYFLQQYFIDWGLLMSSSVMIAIPAIIVFSLAGRYFIQGLTAGSIR